MKKVNLGGIERWDGTPHKSECIADYIKVDARNLPGVDIVADVTKRLPFADNEVEKLRASHVIEHFRPHQLQPALKEWFRILMPGGELKIYCPNAKIAASLYLNGEITIERFSQVLMGRQDYPENTHYMCFDLERLEEELKKVGFEVVQTGLNRYPDSTTYPYDMGIIVKKPRA